MDKLFLSLHHSLLEVDIHQIVDDFSSFLYFQLKCDQKWMMLSGKFSHLAGQGTVGSTGRWGNIHWRPWSCSTRARCRGLGLRVIMRRI